MKEDSDTICPLLGKECIDEKCIFAIRRTVLSEDGADQWYDCAILDMQEASTNIESGIYYLIGLLENMIASNNKL